MAKCVTTFAEGEYLNADRLLYDRNCKYLKTIYRILRGQLSLRAESEGLGTDGNRRRIFSGNEKSKCAAGYPVLAALCEARRTTSSRDKIHRRCFPGKL